MQWPARSNNRVVQFNPKRDKGPYNTVELMRGGAKWHVSHSAIRVKRNGSSGWDSHQEGLERRWQRESPTSHGCGLPLDLNACLRPL